MINNLISDIISFYNIRSNEMNNLLIFLNTQVNNSGTLAWVGNIGLTPFRYLFNGKTFHIDSQDSGKTFEIYWWKKTYRENWNKDRHLLVKMMETALAITVLVPGLLLASFKVFSYLFLDVRKKHALIKDHYIPINRTIGSLDQPIQSESQLVEKLQQLAYIFDPKKQLTNALIIHGNGNLKINSAVEIPRINPMKLILVGSQIVPSVTSHFDKEMYETNKWEVYSAEWPAHVRGRLRVINAHSIEEALQETAPRRSWISCKRYHQIFSIAK